MKIRPLQDKLLVSRIAEAEKTPGGLIIPDAAKEKGTRARVIAVGSGKVNSDGSVRAPSVKAGDVVLLGKYSGSELKLDGEEYVIISEDDVLAVEAR